MTHVSNHTVIADKHALSRAGLAAMFAGEFGVADIMQASDFAGVLAAVARDPRIEAIIVDLELPGMSGSEGLRRLRCEHPGILVVVLAAKRDRELVLGALYAGVHGYVPKDMPYDELLSAFRSVLSGQIYVPTLVSDVSGDPPKPACARGAPSDPLLTDRQRDVLRLLIAGKSNKEIARALHIAEGTVKTHITAAFRILGVQNRVGAAAALRDWQLSEPGGGAGPDMDGHQAHPGAGGGSTSGTRHLRLITR